MSLILFYDTETTGFPKKGRPLEEQPYVVQLAAEVWDEESCQVVHQLNVVFNWDVDIPKEASDVHGWPTTLTKRVGTSTGNALEFFIDLQEMCSLRVGHNEQFDAQLVEIALQRTCAFNLPLWKNRPAFCTMEAMRDVCKLPPTSKMKAAGFNNYKSPKLIEAYRHAFGEDFDGAHNAMADVQACRKVWLWLQKQN